MCSDYITDRMNEFVSMTFFGIFSVMIMMNNLKCDYVNVWACQFDWKAECHKQMIECVQCSHSRIQKLAFI